MANIPFFLQNKTSYWCHYDKNTSLVLSDDLDDVQLLLLFLSTKHIHNCKKLNNKEDFIQSLLLDREQFVSLKSRNTFSRVVKSLVELGYYIPYKRKYIRNPYKIKCLSYDTFLERKAVIDELVFNY